MRPRTGTSVMVTDVDEQYLRRISILEQEMLKPSFHLSSFEDFNRRWTTLVDDLTASMDADQLSSSTITTAYALSQKVTLMVERFRDLDALCAQLMSSLLHETPDAALSDVSNSNNLAPYIKPSYDWLLENIHNPYPSPSIRESIAQKSGATRKDVDNWFIDTRKRIGWNDARKTFFSNKRADIVDAATRFYSYDGKLSLSQGAEHALVSVMKNAKDLYCNKFDETILVTKLASAVKDLTPGTKAEAQAERLRQARSKKDRDPYPSPDRSPEFSPVPCEEEVVATATQSVYNKNRKRRGLSAEEGRTEKRSRLTAPSPPEGGSFPVGLPSPAPSMDELLQVTETITAPTLPSPSFVSRKRRSSESDDQVVPKRPCHLPVGPRLSSVSDPLPIPNNNLLFDQTSFDGWFRQIFDRPGDVSPSSFSVELGNLFDFLSLPESSGRIFQSPTLEVTDIPTVSDELWNKSNLDWNDDSSLLLDDTSLVNFLGRGLTDSLVARSYHDHILVETSKPLTQDLANSQVSSQVSGAANEFENFLGLSALNPVSNATWDFPESSLNRDGASIFGKHNVGVGSNDALLASFNFPGGTGLLAVPDAFSLPTSSQDKLRQEKEKEFRDACEKAQRLALELQKGDLFV